MNDHRLPRRNKILIAAFFTIGGVGLLLQPIYPKSIFVALLVMSIFFAAYLIFFCCKLFREWKQLPTLQKHLLAALFHAGLAASMYLAYLTLCAIFLQ